jgi:hypothetical protein
MKEPVIILLMFVCVCVFVCANSVILKQCHTIKIVIFFELNPTEGRFVFRSYDV